MKMQMSPVAKFFLYLFLVLVTALTLFPLLYTISASVKTNGDIANGRPNLIPSREKSVYERDLNNGDPVLGVIDDANYSYDMFGHVTDNRTQEILVVDNEGCLVVYDPSSGNQVLLPAYSEKEDGGIVDSDGKSVKVNAKGQILEKSKKKVYAVDGNGNKIPAKDAAGNPMTDAQGRALNALEDDYYYAEDGSMRYKSDNQEVVIDGGGYVFSPKSVFKSTNGVIQNAKFLPGYSRNAQGDIVDAEGHVVNVNGRGQIIEITEDNIYLHGADGSLVPELDKNGAPVVDRNNKPVYAINEDIYFRSTVGQKVYKNGETRELTYDSNGYVYKTVMENYLWTENYRKVWTMSGSGYTDTTNFADYTFNSLKVSVLTVIITVVFTAMSAYCFQRGRFPGKTFLYWFFMATMFIGAGTITVFPILRITTTIGINTWWGLAIVVGATGGASNLFLTMGYLKTIPKELDESAKIDGCTFFSTWWRVILPLSIPILGTIALMTFRGSWNNWMLPRLMLASDQTATTLVVAIVNLANNGGAGASQYNLMMAGSMLSMAPMLIMFLIMNETFVEGITQGSVKG